jgi:PadR family transcriptional regulator, regulatory protein PadR
MPRPLGLTSLQILAAIRDGATYGLDIVAYTGLASGTVYPTLSRLRRSGHIQSRWEDQRRADKEGRPRRRYYELSPDGVRALAEGYARVAEAARVLARSAGEAS